MTPSEYLNSHNKDKLTIKDISILTKIPYMTTHTILSGKVTPSVVNFMKIAKVLGIKNLNDYYKNV